MRAFAFVLIFLFISNGLAQPCPDLFLKILKHEINTEEVISFKQKWLSEKVHRLDQNKHYIADTKKRLVGGFYFQIENAVLKQLNDSIIMDKDLVTALDMFLKQDLLSRVDTSPILKDHLVSFYVDFKSLRLQFDSQLGQLKGELNKIYHQSIDLFANQVDELKLKKYYNGKRGLSGDPRYWYLAGVGKSNDQANFASRIGRTLFSAGKAAQLIDFSNHTKLFIGELVKIDHLRRAVMRTNGELYDASGVLALDVIEVLRKVKADSLDSYIEYLGKRLKVRFEKEFSRKDLLMLREYYTLSDVFSPTLLIEQRVVIDMSQTVSGNVSIDIAGMGARNMHELMVSLVEAKGYKVDTGLDIIRRSEIRATEQLEHLRKVIRDSIDAVEVVRKGRAEPLIQETGDDLVFFPTNGHYERRHKIRLLKEMTQKDEASSFRVVFLPHKNLAGHEIPYTERMDIIVRAEDLEKSLRLKLESLIPYERLKKITIASDLSVNGKSLQFSLMVNGGNRGDRRLIENGAKELISEKELGILKDIDFI